MRILIATDGSEFSKAAIKKCCQFMVDPAKTSILIVAAYEEGYHIATEPFAISAEFCQQMAESARKQARQIAKEAVDTLRKCMPGVDIKISTLALRGSPERAVVEEASEWGADLIVVGSHCRGFWGRLTLGSVCDTIVHNAPCSVLVVRCGSPAK